MKIDEFTPGNEVAEEKLRARLFRVYLALGKYGQHEPDCEAKSGDKNANAPAGLTTRRTMNAKERPILFSAPMVMAILSGAKTQTRRVVKVRCHSICEGDDGKLWPWSEDAELAEDFWHPCPFGKPGDRLVVREKWRIGAWDEDRGAVAIDYFDGPRREWIEVPDPTLDGELFNRLWQQSTDDARAAVEAVWVIEFKKLERQKA